MAKKPKSKWVIYQVMEVDTELSSTQVSRKWVGERWAVSAAQAVSFFSHTRGVPIDMWEDAGHETAWHWYLEAEPA